MRAYSREWRNCRERRRRRGEASKFAPSNVVFDATSLVLPVAFDLGRSTDGYYFDSDRYLAVASATEPRFAYHPESGKFLGLLNEPERTNELLWSNKFDESEWVVARGAFSLDTGHTNAKNTTGAYKYLETTDDGGHYFEQTVSVDADQYVAVSGILTPINGRDEGRIYLYDGVDAGNNIRVDFDISAAPATITIYEFGEAVAKDEYCAIHALPNGKFYFQVVAKPATTASHGSIDFRILMTDAGSGSYVGDITKGMYIENFSFELGEFVTSYIETTDSTATRPADAITLTIPEDRISEKAGTLTFRGLITHHDTSAEQTIIKLNAFDTDGSTPDPDEQISISIDFTSSAALKASLVAGGVSQAAFTGEATYDNAYFSAVLAYSENDVNFASQGIVETDDSSADNISNANILSVGTGFFGYIRDIVYNPKRLPNATIQGLSLPYSHVSYNFAQESVSSDMSHTSTGVKTRVNASGNVVSVADNTPRVIYNPATLSPIGVLIEAASQNVCLYSEDFTNAAWTKTNCSVAASAVESPIDSNTMTKIVEDTSSSVVHGLAQTFTGLTINENHVASIFAKKGERNFLYIRITKKDGTQGHAWFNLNTGVVGTTTNVVDAYIKEYQDGVYRCSVIVDILSGGTDVVVEALVANIDGSGVYTGDGASGIYIDAAQFENYEVASSYIPTTTIPVSRGYEDFLSTEFIDNYFNGLQGTIVCEIEFDHHTAAAEIFNITNDSDTDDRFYARGVTDGTSVQFVTLTGAAVQANLSSTAIAKDGRYRFAISYKANDVSLGWEGTDRGTDASVTLPATPTKLLFSKRGVARAISVTIREFTYYNQWLDNPALQLLSTRS